MRPSGRKLDAMAAFKQMPEGIKATPNLPRKGAHRSIAKTKKPLILATVKR